MLFPLFRGFYNFYFVNNLQQLHTGKVYYLFQRNNYLTTLTHERVHHFVSKHSSKIPYNNDWNNNAARIIVSVIKNEQKIFSLVSKFWETHMEVRRTNKTKLNNLSKAHSGCVVIVRNSGLKDPRTEVKLTLALPTCFQLP